MAWIENHIDLTETVNELHRIADALERIAGPEPPAWEPGPPPKKTDTIGKVDIRGEHRNKLRAIFQRI